MTRPSARTAPVSFVIALQVRDLELERRVGLTRAQFGVHGATAGRVEQRRGIAAMHGADRVVRVLAWNAFEGDDAFLYIDELEVERNADSRATSCTQKSAQLLEAGEFRRWLQLRVHASACESEASLQSLFGGIEDGIRSCAILLGASERQRADHFREHRACFICAFVRAEEFELRAQPFSQPRHTGSKLVARWLAQATQLGRKDWNRTAGGHGIAMCRSTNRSRYTRQERPRAVSLESGAPNCRELPRTSGRSPRRRGRPSSRSARRSHRA